MKNIFLLLFFIAASCNDRSRHQQPATDPATIKNSEETTVVIPGSNEIKKEDSVPASPKIFANARFKDVTVERKSEHQFLVKGKAQVFEANVSWVVEDGHNELEKGFVTTDAGAPAWGNFSFTIDIAKQRTNSTLTLILFESSAKDGSRQHELPIVLY
jgi:Immunoglobulin-like domain of bacterial spore germination